jgi:hypothetical protein
MCGFESRPGRGVQHYVIKFVSDLRQVGGFLRVLRFPPPSNKTVRHDITEILLKVALSIINQTNKKTKVTHAINLTLERMSLTDFRDNLCCNIINVLSNINSSVYLRGLSELELFHTMLRGIIHFDSFWRTVIILLSNLSILSVPDEGYSTEKRVVRIKFVIYGFITGPS